MKKLLLVALFAVVAQSAMGVVLSPSSQRRANRVAARNCHNKHMNYQWSPSGGYCVRPNLMG